MTPRISVVLVDDDPLVRAGLGLILGGARDVRIVGEAGDGVEGLDVVDRTAPDVVLMDIRMPHMDGLEATQRLTDTGAEAAVIVLTTFDADEQVVSALRAGASGFLLKDTPPEAIVDAVRKVAAGEPMLSPTVTSTLIRQVTESSDDDRKQRAKAHLSSLTERELEVAVAVGQGKSNADIAAELYMSVATVKAHVSRLLTKLDADNRVQIAIRVHDAGLL
jgi:DNA-binding NarL/FixJ family response regulator